MKKIEFSVLAALLLAVLTFSACSSPENTDQDSVKKKPEVTASVTQVSSSIFGRSIKYNAYAPAEGLSLPVSTGDILEMVQIEKSLYFLANGGVYRLDIETGESRLLFETDASLMACYDGIIYTYSAADSLICSYDTDGNNTESRSLALEEYHELRKLMITDDYIVIHCIADIKGFWTDQYRVFSKETLELTNTVNEKNNNGMAAYVTARAYKENKILVQRENLYFSSAYDLYCLDLENGKSNKLALLTGQSRETYFDFTYNLQTDTVLTLSAPRYLEHHYVDEEAAKAYRLQPFCIMEYSLSDPDNVILQKFYVDAVDATPFISVYENIISAVCTVDDVYRFYDFLNPPESITIAGQAGIETAIGVDVINKFEADTGILVRTVDYNDNYDRLDLKIMAGDKDFDLFCPVPYNSYKYINSKTYVDLGGYESLRSRLSKNSTCKLLGCSGDEYFALPLNSRYNYPKSAYPDTYIDPEGNEVPSTFAFSNIVTRCQYCARNIDSLNGTFNDPNGDELYKVLKYLNENPYGNQKKMPFGDEFMDGEEFPCLYSDYLIINPASENKDTAVKLLEYVFDANTGSLSGFDGMARPYMELNEGVTYFPFWRIMPSDYMQPFYSAFNAAVNEGITQKELKKLAKETAAEAAMRICE